MRELLLGVRLLDPARLAKSRRAGGISRVSISFSNPNFEIDHLQYGGPPAPCLVLNNGAGAVTLPPEGCGYLSPAEVHMAIDGLPPGTELLVSALHRDFLCQGGAQPLEACTSPGGNLGGDVEAFDSTLHLVITGTGALEDFSRVIDIPAPVEIHTAPTQPGQAVQDFDTEIVSLVGALTGDPDFASLTLTAGVDEDPALLSPGHTTLTQQGSSFAVDSFFDTPVASSVGERTSTQLAMQRPLAE